MTSDPILIGIAVVAIGIQIYGAIGLTVCMMTMREALRQLEALNSDGGTTPPAIPTATRKVRRLFRHGTEPEPGGTKVYQAEPWDEGLERTDV